VHCFYSTDLPELNAYGVFIRAGGALRIRVLFLLVDLGLFFIDLFVLSSMPALL